VKYHRLMQDKDALDAMKADKPWRSADTRWQAESEAFAARRQAFLLYE
jgi:hypothetical protein